MKIEKMINRISYIYITAFFIHLALNSILPYVNMGQTGIKNIISAIFILVGLALVLWNWIFAREKYRKNNTYILFIYVIACIISSISMMKYGYIDNLKTILWTIIIFGVLYTFAVGRDKKEIDSLIKFVTTAVSAIFNIAIIIGIYQYIMRNRL